MGGGGATTGSGAERSAATVEIRLPADARLVPAMRLTASGMAASAWCTISEVDDIKLAVSEVLLALIELGSADAITLSLTVADTEFEIVGSGWSGSLDRDDPRFQLSETVLAEVCASHSIDLSDGEVRITASIPIGGHRAD